jgi:hypothetical protein
MFRFNHDHQGAYYLSFAKVIVISYSYFNILLKQLYCASVGK